MRKIALLVALAAIAGPVPVLAQPAPPAPDSAGPAAPGRPDIGQRIDQMHRRLRITPEQEPAWDAFAHVMRENAARDEQAYRQHAAATGSMSALDNLRLFAGIEQQRAQGLQALLASFETLYASLSDAQKRTADAIFRRQEERMEHRARQNK